MLLFHKKSLETNSFTPISEPIQGCWIHADEAKNKDLNKIASLTGIDPSLLYDSLDSYELPRLEACENHLLIFIRYPIEQEGSLYTATLTILLIAGYFITISPFKSRLIPYVLEKNDLTASIQPSDWLREVLLWIAQEFNLFIRKTKHRIPSIGKDFGSVTSEDIYALTKYEEILNQYQSSLDAISLTLANLFKLKSNNVYTQEKEIVEDIENHVKQSESICGIIIKNIRSLRDSYQIIFANNLTKTIKLLTGLTIIITIPNIIASIYGMNVRLPFTEQSHAFSILIGIMIVLSSICGYWFYKKKWM